MESWPLRPLEAGKIYREARTASFEQEAKDIGLASDEEYKRLLQLIKEETQLLEDLGNQQKVSFVVHVSDFNSVLRRSCS